MQLLLILLLGFILIAPPSAHAVTLEITSGSVFGSNQGTSGGFEPDVNVSGADFTLTGGSGQTFLPGANFTVFFTGTLTLDGVTSGGCQPNCITNTAFVFDVLFPEPTPLDLPHYTGPYPGTFTMTGHTFFAGGNDFVGAGIATLGWIFTDPNNPSLGGFQFERFDFVPEPPAAALLTLGLAAALIVHRVLRPLHD
jgi:hypothetical protein